MMTNADQPQPALAETQTLAERIRLLERVAETANAYWSAYHREANQGDFEDFSAQTAEAEETHMDTLTEYNTFAEQHAAQATPADTPTTGGEEQPPQPFDESQLQAIERATKGGIRIANWLILQMAERIRQLTAAIKAHHSQKADDRCIEDDDKLYAAAGLPPCDRRVGNKGEMLLNCARYIDKRCEGGGWPSYRELEAERDELKEELDRINKLGSEGLKILRDKSIVPRLAGQALDEFEKREGL